jgi:hypothetical protein
MKIRANLMSGISAALLITAPAFAQAAKSNAAAGISRATGAKTSNGNNGVTRGNGGAYRHKKGAGNGHGNGHGKGPVEHHPDPDTSPN